MSANVAKVLGALLFVSLCANLSLSRRRENDRSESQQTVADSQQTITTLQGKLDALEEESKQNIMDYNGLLEQYEALEKQYSNLQIQNNLIGPPSTKDELAVAPPKPPEDPAVQNIATVTPSKPATRLASPEFKAADDAIRNYTNTYSRGSSGISTGGDHVGPRGGVFHYSQSGKKVYSKK